MASTPKGSTFFIGKTFSASLPTTVVTNAAEAVVTCPGHALLAGDFVEVTSGWGRLNKRYFKVASPAAGSFVLSGANTSNLQLYAAGGGVGSVRKVTAFEQILQVVDFTSQGGDGKSITYNYFEVENDFSLNDGFNPVINTMQMDADSVGTAGYGVLRDLTETSTDTVLQIRLKNGSSVFHSCTVALNETPLMQAGQINRVTCVFSGNAKPTRYAS